MEVDKEDTQHQHQHQQQQQQQQQQSEENDVVISITCRVDGSIEKCRLSKLQLIPYFATKTSERWWDDETSEGGDDDNNKKSAVVTLHESFANGNSVHALLGYVSQDESSSSLPAAAAPRLDDEQQQEQHPPPSRLLLTKLPRECDLSHVMQLADFFCLDLPGVAKNLEELFDLEMRLKQIKEGVNKSKSKKKRKKKKSHDNSNTNDNDDDDDDDDDEQSTKSRIMAQDAAASLALTIHARKLDTSKKQIKQKLFSDVFFVLSHARTFGPRIRTHVWKSFAALAVLSDKQKAQVAKWTSETALAYDFHKPQQQRQQDRRDDKKSNNGKKSKDRNNNTHSPKDDAKADGGDCANYRRKTDNIEGSSAASLAMETKKCKIGC